MDPQILKVTFIIIPKCLQDELKLILMYFCARFRSKMRFRRLATLFWAFCMLVCLGSIYYFTEEILKAPARESTDEEMKYVRIFIIILSIFMLHWHSTKYPYLCNQGCDFFISLFFLYILIEKTFFRIQKNIDVFRIILCKKY